MPSRRNRPSRQNVWLVKPSPEAPAAESAEQAASIEVSPGALAVAAAIGQNVDEPSVAHEAIAEQPRRAMVPRACRAGSDHRVRVVENGYVLRTDVDPIPQHKVESGPRSHCVPEEFESDMERVTAQHRFRGAACLTGYCAGCGHLFYSSATTVPLDPAGRDQGRVEVVTVDADTTPGSLPLAWTTLPSPEQ